MTFKSEYIMIYKSQLDFFVADKLSKTIMTYNSCLDPKIQCQRHLQIQFSKL